MSVNSHLVAAMSDDDGAITKLFARTHEAMLAEIAAQDPS